LKDAARFLEAEARLAIYAGACEAFIQAFGHPLDSPWRAAGIGVVQSSQIEKVVECLSLIEESACDVSGRISENADFDVGSVMDLQGLVTVRNALGHRTVPVVTGIVAQLDAERLLEVLTALKELQAVEASVAACSLKPIDDVQILATAVELGSREIPAEYLAYTPSALFEIARETIGRNILLRGVLNGLSPVLEYFDLDDRIPSNQLDAVAKAVIVSTKIPPQYRDGLDLNQDINEDAFTALRNQWSGLLAQEKNWRQRFSTFGNERWPAPSQLRATAELLRKSSLSRAFVALSGSAKTARALMARLGVNGSETPVEDLLDLAQHVDALDEFEADSSAEALLGKRWDGLDTAFDQIAFGIKARRYFSEQIGEDLTRRLIKIPQSAVRGLHHFEAAAADFLRTTAKLSDRLDGRPMGAILKALTDENAAMQSILDVDPDAALVGYDVPVGKLVEFAKLRFEQDRVRKVFESSPLKQAAQGLSNAANGVDGAILALDWLSAVRSTDMPISLSKRLTSAAAKTEWERLSHLVDLVERPLESYAEQLEILSRDFGMTEFGQLDPKELFETAATLVAHRDELREYLGVQRERLVLESLGLKDFLARADTERIDPTCLPGLLETIAAYRGAGLARRSAEALHNNSGATLEVRRKQFADKDRNKIRDDRIRIKARLLVKRPLPGSSYGMRKTWTEMALLNNELEKQKRFVPVRTLLAQAGRSMQALKPCFMMSPLSLAKFMKPQSLKFDILVIDEASQMRPEDALGAMLRSSQIIVVGDQKQLPPTDFFARSSEAADNEDDEFEDLDDESILESCQKTFGQRRSLKWHYRSHCESLIRFSNEQFYGNGLITFPAAKPDSFAIDLISVNGVFQARCNPAEASRVAEEAVTFMRHHATLDEDAIPSLGIVAINIQQRNLIQEELNRLIADDVLVDQYREKVLNKGEELFVKNLENVQGDERDFIFISMTYGPEANTSVVKQRFGPINRKQGHRRLNVLFSRARIRIGLFCSFGSADVLPREDSSEGVHVLRRYLEFAETKGRVSTSQAKNLEPDSDFESEVADRLRAKGFAVDYQVGVSGYRIDLGVRHPDYPAQYLAGIECDGAAYHSSKSARDRDRLREEVLNDKGWEIIRVWSTDWFDNPALQTERMVQKLELLRERPLAKHDDYTFSPASTSSILKNHGGGAGEEVDCVSDVSEPEISASADAPSTLLSSDGGSLLNEAQCFEALGRFRDEVIAIETTDWEPHRSILREAMIETFVRQRLTDAEEWFDKVPGYLRQGTNPAEKSKYLERICDIVGRMPSSVEASGAQKEGFFFEISGAASKATQIKLPMGFANSQTGPISRLPAEPAYSATNFSVLAVKPDASRFYDREYGVVLRMMVDHVVTTESPIYEDLLIVRIARAHGFQRAGERIQKTLSAVLAKKYRRTREDDRTVIWNGLWEADQLVPFRPSQLEVRSYSDVPIPELASLAVPLLRLRLADEDVLYRMADQFQLGRLREATRSRFQAAVNFAKEKS
jgi:very-short-patch-repair endonuclease